MLVALVDSPNSEVVGESRGNRENYVMIRDSRKYLQYTCLSLY
jgi:hypothetical protein